MKRKIGLTIAVLSVLFVLGGHAGENKTFTVTGEWIVTGSGASIEEMETIDELETFVEITGCLVDDDGTTYEYIVASGSFTDGKVVLEGEIESRTSVVISVTRGKEAPMTLSAVLIPDTITSLPVGFLIRLSKKGELGYEDDCFFCFLVFSVIDNVRQRLRT
ncbi:MAG: hypothetical protein OXH31_08295 [Gammaproteobacteria bacterium]|nr:hypothetical protein [Gammaproteobacteria bacterium]